MGYLTIDRKIFGHYFWTERRPYSKFEAWLDLIQLVSYKNDNRQLIGGQLAKWDRGQFPVSRSFLADRFTWSENKVRAFIKLLEDDQMISLKTTSKITILTLCNYESYNVQPPDQRPDQRPAKPPDQRPDDHRIEAGSKTTIKEGETSKEGKQEEEVKIPTYKTLFLKVKEDFKITLPKGFDELILEWLKYKSEKGQSYKETGLKNFIIKLMNECDSDYEVAKQMMFYSTSNNYAGLFKEKGINETIKRSNNTSPATDQEVASIIAKKFGSNYEPEYDKSKSVFG